MPEKTPAEKMRMNAGMTVTLVRLPEGLAERLSMPEGIQFTDDPSAADFVLAFASRQAEAEARLTELAPSVLPRTVTWMAYPKGSKAAGYDISRDTIWRFAATVGLVLNANIAIDETFSAVRMRPA